jgi:hypothetical protein
MVILCRHTLGHIDEHDHIEHSGSEPWRPIGQPGVSEGEDSTAEEQEYQEEVYPRTLKNRTTRWRVAENMRLPKRAYKPLLLTPLEAYEPA